MDWMRYFHSYEDGCYFESPKDITDCYLEDLYQSFKKRLLEELEVEEGQTIITTKDNGLQTIKHYKPLHDKTAEKK